MMALLKIIYGTAASLCFAASAYAQNSQTDGQTVGCVEVDCPTGPGNVTSSTCKVDGLRLGAVGVTSYTSELLHTSPTWTMGISVSDSIDRAYVYDVQRTFYLGTPPGLELGTNGTRGCALFLVAESYKHNATLFKPQAGQTWPGPSCDSSGGLPSECLAEMRHVASAFASNDSTTCSAIATALNSQVWDVCNPNGTPNSTVLGQTAYLGQPTRVYGVPLTGSEAATPITSEQNASSNCWPTLPKSNQLTEVFAFSIPTSQFTSDVDRAEAGITPMLNVWAGGANGGHEVEIESLCIQPQFLTTAAQATMQDGGDENAAGITRPIGFGASASFAAAVALLILGFML